MRFKDLLSKLDSSRPVIIQAHDYPDHDALASAYGMSELLIDQGYNCCICYGGSIANTSLPDMITLTNIPAVHLSECQETSNAQIVIVDGFPGNNNICTITGDIVAVIDHHQEPENVPKDFPFIDVRSDYGSCSAIIYEYFEEAGFIAPRDLSTAMLMAILIDTNYLTRGVHPADIHCLQALYHKADVQGGTSVLRNSLSIKDLDLFRYAIDNCSYYEDICIIHLDESCSPELSGLLGDFFLRVREVEIVILLISDGEGMRVSIRSEDEKRSAAKLIQKALKGIGAGGGHVYMAGGKVEKAIQVDRIKQRFFEALKK